ncbi:hypothetical protein ANO11243_016560 [Dothideomycetidae sp. 11243]|nr:hypothetical protein ANO11243_016560 [fungal sp. No.11243]
MLFDDVGVLLQADGRVVDLGAMSQPPVGSRCWQGVEVFSRTISVCSGRHGCCGGWCGPAASSTPRGRSQALSGWPATCEEPLVNSFELSPCNGEACRATRCCGLGSEGLSKRLPPGGFSRVAASLNVGVAPINHINHLALCLAASRRLITIWTHSTRRRLDQALVQPLSATDHHQANLCRQRRPLDSQSRGPAGALTWKL